MLCDAGRQVGRMLILPEGSRLRRLAGLLLCAAALSLAACSTERQSLPERTATEQLLLTAAAGRAVDKIDFGNLRGIKTYLATDTLQAYDRPFLIGEFRDRLLTSGARLVDLRSDASLVVEVRSAALSIDASSSLFGLPSFELPIPFVGPFKTPELAIVKRELEEGIAQFSATSYWTGTGALRASSGPATGKTSRERWVVLFLSWTGSDPPLP